MAREGTASIRLCKPAAENVVLELIGRECAFDQSRGELANARTVACRKLLQTVPGLVRNGDFDCVGHHARSIAVAVNIPP